MDKYTAILKQAEKYLTTCKACSTCRNASESINQDCLQVNYYCKVYQKDVTRHTGFTCNCYAEK